MLLNDVTVGTVAANIYGYGESEEILAEALHPYPDDLVIATKAGFRPGKIEPGKTSLPPLGHPGHIKEECDKSLRRLRLDHIDLYQVHVPDPGVPYADTVGTNEIARLESAAAPSNTPRIAVPSCQHP